jgi:hypothetical protein
MKLIASNAARSPKGGVPNDRKIVSERHIAADDARYCALPALGHQPGDGTEHHQGGMG